MNKRFRPARGSPKKPADNPSTMFLELEQRIAFDAAVVAGIDATD